MPYRGTLKQCIEGAGFNFTVNKYENLAITNNATGKYYALHVLDQNFHPSKPINIETHRIVFQGSLKELLTFTTANQTELFLEGEGNEHTKALQVREQHSPDLADQLPDQNGTQAK